jgi:hypothetical protein
MGLLAHRMHCPGQPGSSHAPYSSINTGLHTALKELPHGWHYLFPPLVITQVEFSDQHLRIARHLGSRLVV